MAIFIVEEKPPHFRDIEFECSGVILQAQICLLPTGKVMISFHVSKSEEEQNLCKSLVHSRGTKLDMKINHLPMYATVDTCTFAADNGSSFFSDGSFSGSFTDCSITIQNNLIYRDSST